MSSENPLSTKLELGDQERLGEIPTVIDLSEAGRFDSSIVGGKAKNLGKLMAAGFPVPAGFCIPTTSGEGEAIVAPALSAFEERGMTGISVRSSANVEDQLAESGYRGIFETRYLPYPTSDLLAETLLHVRNSGVTEKAQAYRKKHSIKGEFKVAVIVQDLIDAKHAGVAMVGAPEDPVYTEVIKGMGDTLVDGAITPSAYNVNNGEVSIRRKGEDLTEGQLREVEVMGRKIVNDVFNGEPQEIEYCYDSKGELFILQARPLPEEITRKPEGMSTEAAIEHMTFHVEALAERSKRGEVLLSDSNIAENLGIRPALISADIFGYIFAGSSHDQLPGAIQLGRNSMGYDCDPQSYGLWGLETSIGGKPYFDFVKDAHTFRMKGFELDDYEVLVDGYVRDIKEDSKKAQYPEVGVYKQIFTVEELKSHFGEEKGERYFSSQETFLANIRRLESKFAKEYDGRKEAIDRYLERSAIDVSGVSNTELVDNFTLHLETLRTSICVDFVKAARLGFFAYDRVRSFLEQHQEILGIPTGKVDITALQVTSNPFGEPYGNPQTEKALRLAEIKRGESTMEDFQREFGHEGVTELDIKRPRFRDNPQMLDAFVQSADPNIEERIKDQERDRETSTDEIVKILKSQGVLGVDSLIEDIDSARLYLVFREKIKYDYLKVYEYLRKDLTELGRRFSLGEKIFDLTIGEVEGLLIDPEQVKAQQEQRAQFLTTARGMYKPATIFSENGKSEFDLKINETNVLEVSNVLGSSVVTGVVQRIIDPYGVTLDRNDDMPVVVVTESTDPGWTAFLGGLTKGDALVTEIGGALSHEAVAAAGFGFAVAYGVEGATTLLQDGQLVQIDPHTNKLTIIGKYEPRERKMI